MKTRHSETLIPLFAGFGEIGQEKPVIETTFSIGNTDPEKAAFDIVPGKNLVESRFIATWFRLLETCSGPAPGQSPAPQYVIKADVKRPRSAPEALS